MVMFRELPFDGIIGSTKELEILQFMISEPNDFYDITDLSLIMGMHRDTVSRIMNKFESQNMVEFRPGRGRSKCYRLNGDSKIVKSFDLLSAALIDSKVPGTGIFETTIENFLPINKNNIPQDGAVEKWTSCTRSDPMGNSLPDPAATANGGLSTCPLWSSNYEGGM